ncbi:MAG: hypothetical protein GX046_07505 [Tissierellia bacterium]|nr:hypothetical protein [Tissierellia bacterium]
MHNIFHLIIGAPGNDMIFLSRRDEDRFLDYARIYKERFSIHLLAYSLKKDCANFLVYDRLDKRDSFAKHLVEAYGYYLQLMQEREVRLVKKIFSLESMEKYMQLMRFLHSEGRNSFKSYQNYSRYVKEDLLDISLVLNSFSYSHKGDRNLLLNELAKEPSGVYALEFKKHEVFKRDKLFKRRERAYEFMENFLNEKDITREEFLKGNFDEEKKCLIRRFREETDLSFRDIGHVLGMSHTTAIRLYNESRD